MPLLTALCIESERQKWKR